MVDNIIKLFSYENRMDLMYVDSQLRSCEVTNNSPLNKKIFKIHKGVDNQIRFRVLNPDRKRVSVDHLSIRARFINTENQERVLDRFADLVPNTKGDIRLTIYEADLVDIAPGFYTMVITGEEEMISGLAAGENIQTPFFLDNAGDIVATVEIVGAADVTITTSATPGYTRFMSSAIPGARLQNYTNSVHSFSAATTGFTGTLEVRGTLDHIPTGDINDYFPIDITSGTQIITFDDYTGITAHSFEANFMWIIFTYETQNSLPSNGTLDKVLVR
jgi:hypothetical protein